MEGFGVHKFRFVNAQDESTFVKFHWKPKLGLQSVAWDEVVKINALTRISIAATFGNLSNQAHFPNGSCKCNCSTKNSPTVSTSTFWTQTRSSPKKSCRRSLLVGLFLTACPTTSSPRRNRSRS